MKHDSRHPGESALVARCFGEHDAVTAEHVLRCGVCATRHAALQAALAADRAQHARVTDAFFTAARLHAQRAEVLARLGPGRRARVLPFPIPHEAASRPRASGGRLGWLGIAAAASMIALAGSSWLGIESRRASSPGAGQRASEPWTRGPATTARAADEAALAAIDLALARPGAGELAALDALTLHSVTAPYGQ